MSYFILLFFASVLTNNIALTYFLGMCPFVTISKKFDVALGMGFAVTFVMTITAVVNYAVYAYVLKPLELDYLQFLVFIVTIASLVQILEIFLDRYLPLLYHAFGIFLPLITVNCAILGVSLFLVLRNYGFRETVFYSFGSGIGWMLAIITMGAIRKQLAFSKPPVHFLDQGITTILAGIMALAFFGFKGVIGL